MDYQIHGTNVQTLQVTLDEGECIFSETGCLIGMSPGMRVETHAPGGIGKMIKRALSKEETVLNYFTATRESSSVEFTTRTPGHVIALPLRHYGRIVTQRDAFICAEEDIEFAVEATLNVGNMVGAAGLMLVAFEGDGTLFFSVEGDVLCRDLDRGQSVLIHPAHVAAFTSSLDYRVVRLQGMNRMLYGEEPGHLVRFTGPGRLWLHATSPHHIVSVVDEHLN